MKRRMLRLTALLLALAILLSVPLTVFAAQRNTGTRHVLCTALSAQAKAYYTGSNTYEVFSQLEGESSGSSLRAVDSALYGALHDLMEDTMTDSVTYKSLTSYWPDTDCSGGSSDAVLFYSDYVSGGYNREHVWPKSRASFHQSGGGADLHHLRPTDSTINSTRNNYTMGNVREHCSSYSTKSNGGKTVLWYNSGYSANGCVGLVEVNDNIKGDVARILLYVYVRWEEPNLFEKDPTPYVGSGDEKNDGNKVIESLDTLLEWCAEDPVDTWEMSRNDAVQAVQGNRNVFIDYPELAWLLFGQEIPADLKTPSGEGQKPAYTLTALSGNTAYGTVTLEGNVVTAVPRTGYQVSGYRLEPADSATVVQTGNTFTVTKLKADCTLTVTFAQREMAEIVYHVPAGVSWEGVTGAYLNDSIMLATVSGSPTGQRECSFTGWAKTAFEATSARPTVFEAGGAYTVTETKTEFYAVYSYVEGGTVYYATDLCSHSNTETVHTEPTCSAAGRDAVVCTDCGSTISETLIPALGHDYEITVVQPTCTEKGYTQYACSRCPNGFRSGFTDPLGHSYASAVTKPATETENGVRTYSCIRCTDSYTETIPALGHDCPSMAFSDLSTTAWYHGSVDYVLSNGLMAGVGNGSFAPGGTVTRAMLVTILYRQAGTPAVSHLTNPFSDVPSGTWYTDAIIWAAETEVVAGIGGGKFAPHQAITREQIAAILYRYEGMPAVEEAQTDFADMENVSAYARTAMCWAVNSGIISGDIQNGQILLAPKDNATRAQLASMLMRYLT